MTSATIERIETCLVDLPTIRPHKLSVATMHGQTLMLVKVYCSDGVVGVGCPASQDKGVTLTAARPGPPWTGAQGGWTGDGCDGASVWTMNPAGKPAPSTLTCAGWLCTLPPSRSAGIVIAPDGSRTTTRRISR